jgi:arylsulfatase A-like enzyme
MSHMGDPNVRTPNMDRLAAEGISFQTAYANSPICTPSRGTIFSGRHAHAGPVQSFFDVYKPAAPSTATILREAGYHTAYFGKWHCGIVRDQISPLVKADPQAYPEPEYFRRTPEYHRGGFQDWFAFETNDEPFNFSYYHQDEIDPRKHDGYQTDILTDLAIDYLETRERYQPLFLVLSPEPPHFPLEAPDSFQRFDPDTLETRENFVDLPGRREQLATYYAMVENLDWNIGRLLDTLARLPDYRDNTLVVYFSDHGEFMGSHGLFNRKEHPHEESVRIPAIFYWPSQIPAVGLRDGLFSLVDMLPTTLGLVGQPVPAYLQGANFAPRCLGEPFDGPEFVLMEMNCNPRWGLDFVDWRALVSDRWKYAYYETGHELLFDLKRDPYELNNIAAVDTVTRDALRRQLLQLLAETAEPYFHILIEHGVKPAGPVINISEKNLGKISPSWSDLIQEPEG